MNLTAATLTLSSDEIEILRDLLGMHTMLPEPTPLHSEEQQHLLAMARVTVKRSLRVTLATVAAEQCPTCTVWPCACVPF